MDAKHHISFENLPELVAQLIEQVDLLRTSVEALNTTKPAEHEYMNVEQALEFLQIAKSTLYNKVHKKEIPHVKFKGSLRFKKAKLRQYMEGQSVGTMEEDAEKWNDAADELFTRFRRRKKK